MRIVKSTATVNIELYEMRINAGLRALKKGSGALGQLVIFVQKAIKGDEQHIDKLHFASTSLSFVMDILILIQCCRSTHSYSLCDMRVSVTVYVLYITCVMLCF